MLKTIVIIIIILIGYLYFSNNKVSLQVNEKAYDIELTDSAKMLIDESVDGANKVINSTFKVTKK